MESQGRLVLLNSIGQCSSKCTINRKISYCRCQMRSEGREEYSFDGMDLLLNKSRCLGHSYLDTNALLH